MYAFETNNLVKKYPKQLALDGLNMHVPQGSIYGFLGVNGAGKTTTFGIAGGFIHATSGEVKINGKVGILPQDARFYHSRKVKSQMKLFALLSGIEYRDVDREVDKVLELVGLIGKSDVAVQEISHGMYKRLGIAQALLGSPDVLLLDEPTAGLDPENAFEIRKLIRSLGKEKTIVISSHNLHEIEEICDYLGIIHQGKMLFEGKIEQLIQSSSNVKYILNNFEESVLVKLLTSLSWLQNFRIEENVLDISFSNQHISLENVNRELIKLLFEASIGVHEVHSGNSLEKIFLEMIGKDGI